MHSTNWILHWLTDGLVTFPDIISIFRTLINQLLSHLCFILILSNLIARPLSIMIFIWGPFSHPTCDFILYINRALYICGLGELMIRQVIKFLYIFQFKHLISINEDFVACFVTLTNFLYGGIFEFVSYFLGYHYWEMDFNICRLPHLIDCIIVIMELEMREKS